MVEKQSAKEAVLVKILRIWGTIIVIAVTAVAFSFASPYFLTFCFKIFQSYFKSESSKMIINSMFL